MTDIIWTYDDINDWPSFDRMIRRTWNEVVVPKQKESDDHVAFTMRWDKSSIIFNVVKYLHNIEKRISIIDIQLWVRGDVFQCSIPLKIHIYEEAIWGSPNLSGMEAFSCLAHYVDLKDSQLALCRSPVELRTFDLFEVFMQEYLLALTKLVVMPRYQEFLMRWEAYFHILQWNEIGVPIEQKYLSRFQIMGEDGRYLKAVYGS